jgi:hypothetical protein
MGFQRLERAGRTQISRIAPICVNAMLRDDILPSSRRSSVEERRD